MLGCSCCRREGARGGNIIGHEFGDARFVARVLIPDDKLHRGDNGNGVWGRKDISTTEELLRIVGDEQISEMGRVQRRWMTKMGESLK